MKTKYIVAIICFIIALAIVIHHFVICGRFFDLFDILHHEWFVIMFVAFGAGLAVGEYLD